MTFTTTITKHSYDRYYKPLPDITQTISGDTQEELFAMFFREYDNAYKYCNSTSYSFTEQEVRKQYHVWFSDIRNYANNGGDMW